MQTPVISLRKAYTRSSQEQVARALTARSTWWDLKARVREQLLGLTTINYRKV